MEGNSLLLSSQAYQHTAQQVIAGAEKPRPSHFTNRTNGTNFPENSTAPPQDTVSLSPQARRRTIGPQELPPDQSSRETTTQPTVSAEDELSADELRELQELRSRDAEVRAHEQAHLAVAGQYAAGGASFSFEIGPNGRRYATEGEVPIDMSKESTPEETLLKMQQVRKAALAPATPSAADRRIAARAAMLAAQAQREIQAETSQGAEEPGSSASTPPGNGQPSETPTGGGESGSESGRSINSADRYMILQQYQAQV